MDTADHSTDTSTPVQTSPSAPSPTRATGPAGASTSVGERGVPEQCSTDPRISDFGRFLALSRAPLGELAQGPASVKQVPDLHYHFQIKDNGFDSCRALSYLVLEGSNGDVERSFGTGGSIADAVVLFADGELITSPAPFEMKTVESVARLSDSEIEVHYGHAGGATAEGVTEYHTFRFFLEDGVLSGAGSLPAEIDTHTRLYLY